MSYKELKNEAGSTLGWLPESKEGGRLRNVIYMTASGTYTKPSWLKFVRMRGVGGGGGGGGILATDANSRAISGPGAAGGYFEKRINAADLASSETVTIGAGGAGGAAGQNAGSAGGTTSFGVHCSAAGGTGGNSGVTAGSTTFLTIAGGVGGVATGGDINSKGENGLRSAVLNHIYVVDASGTASVFSAAPVYGSNGTPAVDAALGAGGAGARNSQSGAATAGGKGGDGIVIIEEYE